MIVYHGSTEIVKNPDALHSFRPLDFGKGFYVTTVREQAERWARRKADIAGGRHAYINLYLMKESSEGLQVKQFDDDLIEWIDFVCQCRDGEEGYLAYDMISGKVAIDKVFRVVDMYHNGIWDRERALKEIRVYPSYDQIAFITQRGIDQMLEFESYEEI